MEHGTEDEVNAVESCEAALTPTEQKIRERIRGEESEKGGEDHNHQPAALSYTLTIPCNYIIYKMNNHIYQPGDIDQSPYA